MDGPAREEEAQAPQETEEARLTAEENEPQSPATWPEVAPAVKVTDRLGDRLTVQCERVDHPSARYTFRIGRPGYISTGWIETPEAEKLNPDGQPEFTFEDLNFDTTYSVRVEVHPAEEDPNKPTRISKELQAYTLNAGADANERAARTRKENEEMVMKLERLQEQIEQLRNELQQKQSECSSHQNELEAMRQRVDEMSTELRAKEDEIEEIKENNKLLLDQERQQKEDAESRIEHMKLQLSGTEREKEDLNAKLQESLRDVRQELETTREQKEGAESSNRDLEQQVERSRTDAEDLHSRLSGLREQIEQLEQQKQETEDQNAELQEKQSELENEKERLHSAHKELEETVRSRDGRIGELQDRLNHLEDKTVNALRNENESLREQLNHEKASGEALQQERRRTEQTLNQFREELDSAKQNNHQLKEQLASASKQGRQERELLGELENQKKYERLLETVVTQLELDDQLKTISEEDAKDKLCRSLYRLRTQEMELENTRSEIRRMQELQLKDCASVASIMCVNPDELQRLAEIVNGNDASTDFPIGKIAKTLKESRGDLQTSVESLLRERSTANYEEEY
eukprot:gb/GECG01004670.1/.p1 GENE.gb/GECG01004670.1/~~gb/GECG01004670.1/.p1  ORF type:complete len:578 (+),score=139.73 gb/GECG01004670.1/:1-1734(+)